MAVTIPAEQFYDIRAPENFYRGMRVDTKLLWENKSYVSLTTIIVCCLDAMAWEPRKKSSTTFVAFVETYLPELCTQLNTLIPGKKGARTLYEEYRNGFTHQRRPNETFVIVEDREIHRAWAEFIDIERGERKVGLNVDRLAREFLALVDHLEATALGQVNL